jgi:hypothetical protein
MVKLNDSIEFINAWPMLQRELDLWAESGKQASFWWRDDDAISDTPQLQHLDSLCQTLLQKQNRVIYIEASMLNARALANAVDKAAIQPIITKQYQMNGANDSAELIKEWLN